MSHDCRTNGLKRAAGIALALLLWALMGCKSSPSPGFEATSLLGRPLTAPPLDDEERAKREAALEDASIRLAGNPRDEQAMIWLGRRLAYLGRYREAIDQFSAGLAVHPNSYRLLRHRGHRYITIRQFAQAEADLGRAAMLVRGIEDEIEPDGQPNAQNQPRSTTQTNIWYHLGLAQYLQGRFDAAATSFGECMRLSTNDDMRCAAGYWLWLSCSRAHRDDEAKAVLEKLATPLEIIENHSYAKLIDLFAGRASVDAIERAMVEGGDDVDAATLGYGAAMWRLLHGEPTHAQARFQRVIDSTNWAAFGHIAAEAEIARE